MQKSNVASLKAFSADAKQRTINQQVNEVIYFFSTYIKGLKGVKRREKSTVAIMEETTNAGSSWEVLCFHFFSFFPTSVGLHKNVS